MSNNHPLKQLTATGRFRKGDVIENKTKISELKERVVNLDTLDRTDFSNTLEEISLSRSLRDPFLLRYEDLSQSGSILSFKLSSFTQGTMNCREAAQEAALSEALIFGILEGILSALHYLHSHHIIHRSVQADHIQLGDRVQLGNLQHCVHMKRRRCHGLPNGINDRLPWVSPEMIRQDTIGYNHRTDLYSVGITILELLAGYAPFEGFPNTKIYLMKLSSQTILPFSKGAGPSHISKRLIRVIDKCVQYEPNDRADIPALLKSSFFCKMRNKSHEAETSLLKQHEVYNNKNCIQSVSQDQVLIHKNNTQTSGTAWIF